MENIYVEVKVLQHAIIKKLHFTTPMCVAFSVPNNPLDPQIRMFSSSSSYGDYKYCKL